MKKEITLKIDEDLLEQADLVFNNLGTNREEAINMFLNECVKEKQIPFESLSEDEIRVKKILGPNYRSYIDDLK